MMSEQSPVHTVNEFFPPLANEITPYDIRRITQSWGEIMHRAIDKTAYKFNINAVAGWHKGIDAWLTHPDHGAQHSLNVYYGARYMMQQEGVYDQKRDDSIIQIEAVMHDIFQILPNLYPQTGNEVKNGDKRLDHPMLAAIAIVKMGRMFGIDRKQARTIAKDVLQHDNAYDKKRTELSNIGKYIADADKLFGAGLETDPKKMVGSIIDRNRQGVMTAAKQLKPDGWPLLRDDIDDHNWKYGDRWYADRLSAVIADIYGLEFETKIGKEIGQQRREVFLEVAQEKYGQEYDEMQDMVKHWQNAIKQQQNIEVELIGKNKDSIKSIKLDNQDLPLAIINTAYYSKLLLPLKTDKAYPKGWMVKVTINDETFIIDPSIARFSTKEKFLEKLAARIKSYSES